MNAILIFHAFLAIYFSCAAVVALNADNSVYKGLKLTSNLTLPNQWGCVKINVAKTSRNTTKVDLAKIFPGEKFPWKKIPAIQ